MLLQFRNSQSGRLHHHNHVHVLELNVKENNMINNSLLLKDFDSTVTLDADFDNEVTYELWEIRQALDAGDYSRAKQLTDNIGSNDYQ